MPGRSAQGRADHAFFQHIAKSLDPRTAPSGCGTRRTSSRGTGRVTGGAQQPPGQQVHQPELVTEPAGALAELQRFRRQRRQLAQGPGRNGWRVPGSLTADPPGSVA